MTKATESRDNHYVPQWYQRGFLSRTSNKLHYLDLDPEKIRLPDGKAKTLNSKWQRPTSQCFYQTDLYTTFFGSHINDEIERLLFGEIDDTGAKAVRAYIDEDPRGWHENFSEFFSFIDSQKIRTPKGLDWIKNHYPDLNQVDLMVEMQAIRNMHCTLWTEGVREIVSAEKSSVRFILSDHPVTIYNYACDPASEYCVYPNDPSIALKATQTLFPLDENHCLILTNLEYAKDPDNQNPLEKRTFARFVRNSIARTDALIRTRHLDEAEVATINMILKQRARRYIAASNEDWLYPEKAISNDWRDLKNVLLPPDGGLFHFGGEMYVGHKDGSTYYQDEFGRTTPENKYLKKEISEKDIGRNDPCGCGSGRKYKKCCLGKPEHQRTAWDLLSIRERNLTLYNGIEDILGFNKGKTWDDVRRELSSEQVAEIHRLYGFLWPIDTDIFALLPKPDNTLRALYTGTLDPRVITGFGLGASPYFDELLIQHPFINPNAVNPKFSPVDSPHQHKHQALKNILLFSYLQPFVMAGIVNCIPDPCSFDSYLHRQMMTMAEGRRGGQLIDKKEKDRFMKMAEEDFARTMRILPREQQIYQIRQAMPEIADDELEGMLDYMKQLNEQDPLALLQEDVFADGGQLMISSMAPNFEMALFIAQATGSIIVTDSETRWQELRTAQSIESGITAYPWDDYRKVIEEPEYFFSAMPEVSFENRMNGNCGGIRNSFRELFLMTQGNNFPSEALRLERFQSQFIKGHQNAMKGFDTDSQTTFKVKMNILMPRGGMTSNNVQRLLLKSGSQNHLSCAPMAIFIDVN